MGEHFFDLALATSHSKVHSGITRPVAETGLEPVALVSDKSELINGI